MSIKKKKTKIKEVIKKESDFEEPEKETFNDEDIFGEEIGTEQEEFDDWGYEEDEELM